MSSDQKRARVFGALYLITFVTSIPALWLYEPALRHPAAFVAGAGWTWVVQGWRLFARSPVMWIVAVLLLCIMQFALLLIPLLGAVIVHVLNPVFAGGLALACRVLER